MISVAIECEDRTYFLEIRSSSVWENGVLFYQTSHYATENLQDNVSRFRVFIFYFELEVNRRD